ncbi:MAG: ABC transporter ATP-binding protein, partial [Deltaproteobacteria bacterium]|nr:ABC transporter ATP-binding protein [Deltaproteobacteria bacterium]
GEAVGIVGRNGAGKRTLLKILSRITEPTTGYAEIHGRVGTLLEVGTGFHPELTGRENIYLNGSVLGMKRTEIDRKFDEIVAFSEVEKFIDTPAKHYSSGMYLKLAFAVAAHLEPEIILVDEVLAVGDAAFQKKCLGRMGTVAQEGRTVIFVSHNMGAITQLCKRALWIEGGGLKRSGPSAEIVTEYLSSGTTGNAAWVNPSAAPSGSEARLKAARLLARDGVPSAVFAYTQPFRMEVEYDVLRRVRDLTVTCLLYDSQGNIVFETMDTDMPEWKGRTREPGRYVGACEVPGRLLKPGRYFLSIHSFIEYVKMIERQEGVLTFDVSEVGSTSRPQRRGVIAPSLEWKVTMVDEPAPSQRA